MAGQVFDDVAFYFVGTSFIGCGALLTTLYILYNLIPSRSPVDNKKTNKNTNDATEKAKNERLALLKTANKSKVDLSQLDKASADDIKGKLSGRGKQTTDEVVKPTKTTGFVIKKRYILAALLWGLFVLLLSFRGQMTNSNFTAFDPYDVLEVPYGSTELSIKRAYRKLAKKWHPDSWNDPKEKATAEEMFMKITKAHQALTDPVSRENYERFGNVDGAQQGPVSMTYGLPTILTNKKYEVPILIGYLIFFIMLPMYALYRLFGTTDEREQISKEIGLAQESIGWIAQSLQNDLTAAQLVEISTLTLEYREEFKDQTDERVKNGLVKILPQLHLQEPKNGKIFFVIYGYALFHAHLQHMALPNQEMIDDQKFFLSKIGLILTLIVDLSRQARVPKVYTAAIDLMQSTFQGLRIGVPLEEQVFQQFSQFLTQQHGVALRKQGVKTLADLRTYPRAECVKLLGIAENKYDDLMKYVNTLPIIKLDTNVTIDEETFEAHPADVVSIEYSFQRILDNPSFKHDNTTVIFPTKEQQEKLKEKQALNLKVLTKEEIKKQKRDAIMKKVDNWEFYIDNGEERRKKLREQQLEEERERNARKAAANGQDLDDEDDYASPVILSQNFPFKKREVWYLSLCYVRNNQEFMLQTKRFKNFPLNAEPIADRWLVQLPQDTGVHDYKLVLRCDSYFGCDVTKNIKITITDPKAAKKQAKKTTAVAEKEGEDNNTSKKAGNNKKNKKFVGPADFDDDGDVIDETVKDNEDEDDESDDDDNDEDLFEEDDVEEEEAPTYWYYLGGSTFWEGILNAVIIAALLGALYMWLHKMTWFKIWVQPMLTAAWKYIRPHYIKVHDVAAPAVAYVESLLRQFLGEEKDLPRHIKIERAFNARRGIF